MNANPSKPSSSSSNTVTPPPQRGRKLLDQVRDAIRLKHYSERTGETYEYWIKKYVRFHSPGLSRGEVSRHPSESNFKVNNGLEDKGPFTNSQSYIVTIP